MTCRKTAFFGLYDDLALPQILLRRLLLEPISIPGVFLLSSTESRSDFEIGEELGKMGAVGAGKAKSYSYLEQLQSRAPSCVLGLYFCVNPPNHNRSLI
jgi:hypothetical protein